jgi:hypothetical protein
VETKSDQNRRGEDSSEFVTRIELVALEIADINNIDKQMMMIDEDKEQFEFEE